MIFTHMVKFPEDKISFLLKEGKKDKSQKDLIIREGGRHTHMVSLAGFYRHKGYSQQQIFALLDTANRISFSDPLEDDEIEDITDGCSKYETLYDEYTVNLDEVEEKPMECIVVPYISRYDANIIEGDPGVGKSTVLADLVACITTGKEFCGIKPDVTGDVLFFAIEDNIGTVFKTRARLQGADQKKIDVVDGFLALDDEGFAYLEQALSKKNYALVIIDTITSSLANGTDMNNNADMAKLFKRLTALARDYRTTFLAVRHTRKAAADQSIHVGSGAQSIAGGVRSAMLLKVHPDDKSIRFLAHSKSNGLKLGSTLTFTIKDAPNEKSGIGQLVWMGKSEFTADDLLFMTRKGVQKKDDATTFLEEILANKPVDSKIVEKKAKEQGLTIPTLRRAKKELGVISRRKGTGWVWSLK